MIYTTVKHAEILSGFVSFVMKGCGYFSTGMCLTASKVSLPSASITDTVGLKLHGVLIIGF